MARPARQEQTGLALSSHQLIRFYRSINRERVFGTHSTYFGSGQSYLGCKRRGRARRSCRCWCRPGWNWRNGRPKPEPRASYHGYQRAGAPRRDTEGAAGAAREDHHPRARLTHSSMTFERGRLERLLFWLSALTEHQATKQPICFERNRTGTAPSHCHGRVGCCRARRFPPHHARRWPAALLLRSHETNAKEVATNKKASRCCSCSVALGLQSSKSRRPRRRRTRSILSSRLHRC